MEQKNTLGSHSSFSWSHLGEAGIFKCDSSAFLQTSKFTGDELTLQQGLFFSLGAEAATMSTEIGFWRDDSLLESPFFKKEESVTENTHHFQNPPGDEAIKFHCHPCSHKTFLHLWKTQLQRIFCLGDWFCHLPLSHQVFTWGRKVSQPHGRGTASQIFAGASHLLKPLHPFLDLDQNPAAPELPPPASQADSITKIPPLSSPE